MPAAGAAPRAAATSASRHVFVAARQALLVEQAVRASAAAAGCVFAAAGVQTGAGGVSPAGDRLAFVVSGSMLAAAVAPVGRGHVHVLVWTRANSMMWL